MVTNPVKIFILLISLIMIMSFPSCKKYLDAKSDQKLVTPSSVQDLQGLMDSYTRVNQFNAAAAEKSADDYYLTTADWSALTVEQDKRMYYWEKDYLFKPGGGNDWANSYDNVYRANLVIKELNNIIRQPGDELDFITCRGNAYFLRAVSFLKLAIIWSPAYDAADPQQGLGIPLRLDPDFNYPSVRSSVQQTFQQIVDDAKKAAIDLPVTPLHLLRPSRPAAYALIARAYLAMGSYDSCLKYSIAALQLKNDLKDFNTLNASASYPMSPRFSNPEIIYDTYMNSGSILSNSRAKIDSVLYGSYAANDLRKTVFFKNNNNGTFGFKGSYAGSSVLFDGLAVDELYLMQAECLAREQDPASAMTVLNTLLSNRYKTNTFVPLSAIDAADALNIILTERRKELLMRGLRWMDIKRLNKEGRGITLTRIVDGETYSLQPNDYRFALPIPEDVIALSGMMQNPR